MARWGQYAGRNLERLETDFNHGLFWAGGFVLWASKGNLHFGIREHAMGSIMNGLALCKLRPFGATFLATWTSWESFCSGKEIASWFDLMLLWLSLWTQANAQYGAEVFSDYMRPPIRLSAIMETPCIFVFTHDSIGRVG
jgi:transketolase